MHRFSATAAFAELLEQRLSRRRFIGTAVALAPLAACMPARPDKPAAAAISTKNALTFTPIVGSNADAVMLPPGYVYDVVARWGDSLFTSTPDLQTQQLSRGALIEPGAAAKQSKQFGTNCDAVHFFPLDHSDAHGILCVNNEYTDHSLMHVRQADLKAATDFCRRYPESVAVAKAAQGVSIVEVRRIDGRWQMVRDSQFNRRITAQTPIEIGGPARGAQLLKTRDDPSGTRVLGTFANCAGGETPWGTYLTTEENIQDYFGNLAGLRSDARAGAEILNAHRRFRMRDKSSAYGWEAVDARFDMASEPNEAFRFGWIVEIDPRDPQHTPIKRTALGRFAHEGASPFVARNGRVAVYMGDDEKFEYVYKFVSTAKFNAQQPGANRDLLDDGVLYVARFDAEGGGKWLPLLHDERGPLNTAAGFANQTEVLIKARAAAHLLGATPMDRPEDIEANPTTGRIYIACTRNESRTATATTSEYAGRNINTGPNSANLRGANPWGHIIEIHESDDDHTALTFSWEVFLLAGDPQGGQLITDLSRIKPGDLAANDVYYAGYGSAEQLSPLGSPDNIGFDPAGNLWIVSDGAQPRGGNNGCFACPTAGPDRGRLQQFMSAPVGAEVCGCQFTSDGKTLFISIQHPGEGGTVEAPKSHWPDGAGTQPRSSVIAIRRQDGGIVGT